MSTGFSRLVEQVPKNVYSIALPLISDKIALFRPKSYIIGHPMRSEDYSFVLPSTVPPVAKIGKHEHHFKKDCLIAIGSDVEYFCGVNQPTREYINVVIKKGFFEQVSSEAIGRATVDFHNVVYARNPQLLRLVADLQNELTYYSGDCSVMVESIAAQIVVQVLRDTGVYTRVSAMSLSGRLRPKDTGHTRSEAELVDGHAQGNGTLSVALLSTSNPLYFSILSEANSSLPERNRLTARETEIASYLLDRLDYGTMAARLLISPNTVKTHVKRIYDKLDISRRKQLETRIGELVRESGNKTSSNIE